MLRHYLEEDQAKRLATELRDLRSKTIFCFVGKNSKEVAHHTVRMVPKITLIKTIEDLSFRHSYMLLLTEQCQIPKISQWAQKHSYRISIFTF